MNAGSITGSIIQNDRLNFQKKTPNTNSCKKSEAVRKYTSCFSTSAAEVTEKLEKRESDIEAEVQELQRISDMLSGNKLEFKFSKELNKVIVKVVNSSTDEVIREIPSEDLQRIQVRMKQVIGILFDEVI